jgi:hypothetical protein
LTRADRGRVARFFRSRGGARRAVSGRLVAVLAHLGRHFGGKRILLMSGYRAPDAGAALRSYHQVGRAADVAIPGVSCRDLFERCRALQRHGMRLGCGLYPRGRHVHVDVRSRSTTWVDLSGYRDGAAYVRDPERWLAAHPDAGRDRCGGSGHARHEPAAHRRTTKESE